MVDLYPEFMGFYATIPKSPSLAILLGHYALPGETDRILVGLSTLLAGYALELRRDDTDSEAALALLTITIFLFGAWLGQRGGSLVPLSPPTEKL